MPRRPTSAARVLALAVAMLGTGGAASALTVEAYMDLAKRREATNSLDRYFDGLRDGVLDYNAAMLSAGIKVFCPPQGKTPLEGAELRRQIDAWLRNPQNVRGASFAEYAKATPVGIVALEVLNDLYVCPEDEPPPGIDESTPR